MGRHPKFDDGDIELMQALRDEGIHTSEIAKKFGCSGQTVKNITTSDEKPKLTVSRLKTDSLDGLPPEEDQPIYCKGEIIGYFVTTKTWGEI